jgi:hypothetical protein
MCETSINWNKNTTRKLYKQILGKKFKKNSLVTSRLPNLSENIHLPGGTATFSRDGVVSKIEKSIQDDYHMGRWTGSTFRVNNDMKLNIISAYRVINQKVTPSNSMSTNSQQHHIMRSRGIDDVKPRTQFILDFCTQFTTMCNNPKEMTILMIDANECTSAPETIGITHLMKECGLSNIYKHIHDDHEEFPTHINGSKTIDYMLGSENVMQFINKMGYIKFHECFDSDHRGLYCDLSQKLFQKQIPPSVIRTRVVGSNSTNAEGERYIRQLHNHLQSNNIFQKSESLLEQSRVDTIDINIAINQLNKIDKIITDGMLHAENKQCKKKDPVMWTPAIQQSNLRVQYWNIRLKSTRQRI